MTTTTIKLTDAAICELLDAEISELLANTWVTICAQDRINLEANLNGVFRVINRHDDNCFETRDLREAKRTYINQLYAVGIPSYKIVAEFENLYPE
jgi:hypothetical protein